jgi:hypothetical protein
MAPNPMIDFWCYVEGTSDYTLTSISPDLTIRDLKEQIYVEEKIRFITQCGPSDLTIMKVCYIMAPM